MKEQRAHQQSPTPSNQHHPLAARIADLGLGIGSQASQSMRARHDTQRSVFRGARVEMESDRDEAFQNHHGWLHEKHTLFDRPAAALGMLNPLPD